MVVLQGFVDDSASDVGDRRIFLVAVINGAEQWAAFADEWHRELQKDSLAYFKMAEANSLRGQFAGWTRDRRDAKVLALARIIERHHPWFTFCSVSRKEYDEILAPVAPQGLKTPYYTCFWGVMKTTARYHQSLGIEDVPPVDFIFDDQGGLGDDAALFYRWAKESEDPETQRLLGSTPIFRDDKTMPPLQAADMLAWHIRKDHETGGHYDRAIFELLTENGAGVHMPAAELRKLAKKMRRVPGVKHIQTKKEWRETRSSIRAQLAAGAGPPRIDMGWMRYIAFRAWVERTIHRWRYPRR